MKSKPILINSQNNDDKSNKLQRQNNRKIEFSILINYFSCEINH